MGSAVGSSAYASPLRRQIAVDVSELRTAGVALLGAGLLLPALGHPGVACPLRSLTGIPCPLCGMSTSVEATLHGRLGAAAAANPVGIAAVGVALWFVVRPPGRVHIPPLLAVAGLAAMWAFELVRFWPFRA